MVFSWYVNICAEFGSKWFNQPTINYLNTSFGNQGPIEFDSVIDAKRWSFLVIFVELFRMPKTLRNFWSISFA